MYFGESSRYIRLSWRTGCWAFCLEHDSPSTRLSLCFSHKQHDFTMLDLLTTVLPATCEEWDWGTGSPRVPSAVAQQRPIWPIGVKPSSATGSLIMNTPTLALWLSVGWITIEEDGFCAKRKKKLNVEMLFMVAKPTILDKINGTPGPPLPPIQWCQNGAFLLLRAFIIALGGMGDNCSTLFCPRLSENHTGVTRSYICYAHHIWSDVASQDNQGKRTRAEIKSVRDSSRLEIKSQHDSFLVCHVLYYYENWLCIKRCWRVGPEKQNIAEYIRYSVLVGCARGK